MKGSWKNFWANKNENERQFSVDLDKEYKGFHWQVMQDYVDTFQGLNTIELGCGRGVSSLLMANKGADVTLVDYSTDALNYAQMIFENHGLEADYIEADVTDLPASLMRRFDISVSIGLVEHFEYPQRYKVIQSHYDVLKDNGRVFVSTPNKFCPSYRIYTKLSQLLGLWNIGLEKPFSARELKKVSRRAGFHNVSLRRSYFMTDSLYFLFRGLSRLSDLSPPKSIPALKMPGLDLMAAHLLLTGIKK